MDIARKQTIRDNYQRVLEKIENAKARRNVKVSDVTLLAATKTVPAEEILFAVNELGLPLVGENKVQEFLSKYEDIKNTVPLHLIGHLQTNKVKSIVGKVDMIQSVDSLRLANEISRRSIEAGVVTKVLCEINIGREENKSGLMPENVLEFADEISELGGISVAGLMTMAPVCESSDEYKKYFEKTYAIYLDFLRNKRHNKIETVLSMGMSDSFEAAIEEGATLVRVGSSIFGKRVYL
ncbi:MAG: YggS family pyridoxal phosphate-dependent enzyme [Ruminococcaceae bacterium]|nr:YggS family pyridoxal phosphate-dependent enzyme [Oscillospiraceae bacterium]